MKEKKAAIAFARYLCMIACAIPVVAYAAPPSGAPRLSIEIPGFKGFSEVIREGSNIIVPYIAEYVAALYRWSIGAAMIICAAMIAIGGFEYVTAGGIPKNISSAKNRIRDSLTGLLLLITSYIFLYSLNPDLVKLQGISIFGVQNIAVPEDVSEEAGDGMGVGPDDHFDPGKSSAAPINATNCLGLSSYDYSNKSKKSSGYLRTEAATAFKKAIEAAKEKKLNIHVNADIRTKQMQQVFRDRWVAKARCGCVDENFLAENKKNCSVSDISKQLIESCKTSDGMNAYKASFKERFGVSFDSVAPAGKPDTAGGHMCGLAVDVNVADMTNEQYKDFVCLMEAQGFKVLGKSTQSYSYGCDSIPKDWNDKGKNGYIWNEHHHFDYGNVGGCSPVICSTTSSPELAPPIMIVP